MARPMIGISGSLDQLETRLFLLTKYESPLLQAGAVPVLLSPFLSEAAMEDCLRRLDGVMLAGGNDLAPELFGCEPIEALGEVNPARDRFECALVRRAFAMRMPVLGICRGVQSMNVAMGGTLWQDLPAQYRTEAGQPPMAHSQKRADFYPSHTVTVEPGTLLHGLCGQTTLRVNSMHHQAVRDPADGLLVCARASDGVIEAVEHPAHPFFLGVQWHPERYFDRDARAMALFEGFVDACACFASQPDRP